MKAVFPLAALLFAASAFGQGNSYQPQLLTGFGAPGTGALQTCAIYQQYLDVLTGNYYWCKPDNSGAHGVWTVGIGNIVMPIVYGAKCDGVTDDSTALQNAINAALVQAATSPATLFVPPGKVCAFGTTLQIQGVNTPPVPSLLITGGNPKGNGRAIGGSGFLYTGTGTAFNIQNSGGVSNPLTVDIKVSNLYFEASAAATAIWTANVVLGPITFENNFFNGDNTATDAIFCPLNCGLQFNIDNNFFNGFTGKMVHLLGGGNYSITRNQLFFANTGIYVTSSPGTTIRDNYFEHLTNYIEVGNDVSEGWGSYDIQGNLMNAGSLNNSSQRCLFVSSTNNGFPFYVHGSFKNNFCNLSAGIGVQGLATYNVQFATASNTFNVTQTWEVENNTFLGAVTSAINNDNANVQVVRRDNTSLVSYSVSTPASPLTEISGAGSFSGLMASGNSSANQLTASTFANLGTPANGTLLYCSDCTIANPCAGSGTGAVAKRLNSIWVCN